MNINIPAGFTSKLIKLNPANFLNIRFPQVIEGFQSKYPAEEAGLQINDRIIGINNISTPYINDLEEKYKNTKASPQQLWHLEIMTLYALI